MIAIDRQICVLTLSIFTAYSCCLNLDKLQNVIKCLLNNSLCVAHFLSNSSGLLEKNRKCTHSMSVYEWHTYNVCKLMCVYDSTQVRLHNLCHLFSVTIHDNTRDICLYLFSVLRDYLIWMVYWFQGASSVHINDPGFVLLKFFFYDAVNLIVEHNFYETLSKLKTAFYSFFAHFY